MIIVINEGFERYDKVCLLRFGDLSPTSNRCQRVSCNSGSGSSSTSPLNAFQGSLHLLLKSKKVSRELVNNSFGRFEGLKRETG